MAPRGSKPATKPKASSAQDQADSPTRAFFERLQDRGFDPILQGDSGTLRFDLSRPSGLERWYVTVSRGKIAVSHARSGADTVVKVDGELFDRVAAGTANAFTAQFRGVLEVEGDFHLLMVFQRLFPGPPRQSTGVRPAVARKTGVRKKSAAP